ncbi:MAG TPA: M14 family zinc carboxypeptidase [Thermoleophilaceae bacterium]
MIGRMACPLIAGGPWARHHPWMHVRARRLAPAVIIVAASAGAAVAAADDDDAGHVRSARQAADVVTTARLLGRSVQGRPIRAFVRGDPQAPIAALVVGCIHGNERAGVAIANRLRGWRPPAGMSLWIVPDINPDGAAANTRGNAHGVDLNRNFPFHWRPLGPPGTLQYAGPHPLSEPEDRIAHSLILRLRPRLTIWFHQPLSLTDRSGGDVRLERRYSRLSRLPLRQLPRYPGSITTWQDFRLKDGTAFVVELPAHVSRAATRRYSWAVTRLVIDVATKG